MIAWVIKEKSKVVLLVLGICLTIRSAISFNRVMRQPEINKNYGDMFKLKKPTQVYPIFDLIDDFLHC